MTKSRNLKIFKSQYLSKFLRFGPDFLHVIMNFKTLPLIGLTIFLFLNSLSILWEACIPNLSLLLCPKVVKRYSLVVLNLNSVFRLVPSLRKLNSAGAWQKNDWALDYTIKKYFWIAKCVHGFQWGGASLNWIEMSCVRPL